MEENKQCPTVPSNYVTLAQLEERWLKEKERKEREKVEEEERKQREKEEEERRREVLEKRGQNENGRSKTNSVSINRGPYPGNRRGQSGKNRRTVEVRKPEWAEQQLVAAVFVEEGINNQGQKVNESKKNRNKNRKKGKPRALEDLIEGKAQLPPEKELDENNPVVGTERNGTKDGIRSAFRRNGKNLVNGKVWENEQGREKPEEKISVLITGRNSEKVGITCRRNGKELAVTGKVWEQKAPVYRHSEIGLKFENVSLNDGKEGKDLSLKDGITCRRNGKELAVTGKVWEQKAPVDRHSEIGLKFENVSLNDGKEGKDLSLKDGKEGNEKSMVKMKSSSWMNNNSPGRLNCWNLQNQNSRNVQKPRISSLVWVRKEEINNANAAGIRCSGSLVKVKEHKNQHS
ncbi:hypothetical protein F0562_027558 [Nyssa sinensis]|uniref:Uncharacterized protein n=1 Tax=Nyssa sinensis TaxID=561372 RepID=A0A5J5B7K6_9ASTE|nr:hypothetical protein F0562_027558 [Nyssa sinensis]